MKFVGIWSLGDMMGSSTRFIDKRQNTLMEGMNLLHSVVVANEVVDKVRGKRKRCLIFMYYLPSAIPPVGAGKEKIFLLYFKHEIMGARRL